MKHSVALTLILLATGPSAAWAQFAGGSGDPCDPYLIADPNHLFALAADPCYYDEHFKLIADLDLDPNLTGVPSFTTALIAPDVDPATNGFQGISFAGVFDGSGCRIANLTIDTAGAAKDYLGLFGKTEAGAGIIHVALENVTITPGNHSDYIGALCGHNDGTIAHCSATANIVGESHFRWLGGLCGMNDGGSISDCYAQQNITTGIVSSSPASVMLGGLCGRNYSGGAITNSHAQGNLTAGGVSSGVGGLCGGNDATNAVITNCYANTDLTGGDLAFNRGGLCGHNYGAITNCYATGNVQGWASLGGLCGVNNELGIITNSYARGSVQGTSGLGGLCGSNEGGTIAGCYATGNVVGGSNSDQLGGLAGANRADGLIMRSYSTGAVTSQDSVGSVGGLSGRNEDGSITDCYAAGAVTGGDPSQTGGLCGYTEWRTTISNCFWDTQTSGLTVGIGTGHGSIANVSGKITLAMKQKATFAAPPTNWQFVDAVNRATWRLCIDGTDYPRFAWQFSGGDLLCPDGVTGPDFAFFASYWNRSDCPEPNYCHGADLNYSNDVGPDDLIIFADNWLTPIE